MAVIASNMNFFRHQASDDADAQKRNFHFFYNVSKMGLLRNPNAAALLYLWRSKTVVTFANRFRKINSTASWQMW